MIQYKHLARCYDLICGDSFHRRFLKHAESLLKRYGCRPGIVWELGCGTGTLTRQCAKKGYEMISTDISPEMLAIAEEKCRGLDPRPVFICQDMEHPDLYGTVNTVFSSLDTINYITEPSSLLKVFKGISLFLEPGGLFIFDIKTIAGFRDLAGKSFCYENDEFFCTWRYGYDPNGRDCRHDIDIFIPSGKQWERLSEVHLQHAYYLREIIEMLKSSGFEILRIDDGFSNIPAGRNTKRAVFCARKK